MKHAILVIVGLLALPDMVLAFEQKDIDTLMATRQCEECDLRNADLKAADLKGARLAGANLRDADLKDADLGGADLRGADLRRADLEKTALQGARLDGANLVGADMEKAQLDGAQLGGADLRGADMEKANLKGAVLVDAGWRWLMTPASLDWQVYSVGEGWFEDSPLLDSIRDEPRFIAAVAKVKAENAAMLAELNDGLTLEDIKDEDID